MLKQAAISTSVLEGMLLDAGGVGNGPTDSKLSVVFHALDTIIPQLGVYKPLVKLCRDELHEGVYSHEVTANTVADHCCMQRIPYFVLSQRLSASHDDRNDELVKQLEHVNQQLLATQLQNGSMLESIDELENDKLKQLATVDSVNNQLHDEQARNDSLENDINALKKKLDEKSHSLNCDILRLQKELHDAVETTKQLLPYKTSYELLRIALHQSTGEHGSATDKQTALQSVALASDVDTCLQLEEQILSAQNAIIEEYDEFIEGMKHIEFVFPVPGYQLCLHSNDAVEEDDSFEVMVTKEHFKSSLSEIENELALLNQHKDLLEAHLAEAGIGNKSFRSTGSNVADTEQDDGDDLNATDELSLNPFTPHERLFNKYAVMLYTSDNDALSFTELNEAVFCPYCAEKTVICPHKLLEQEHVITLPGSTTHLKVARPRLPLTTSRNVLPSLDSDLELKTVKETDKLSFVSEDERDLDICVAASFDWVWKDYETRTDKKRQVARQLSLDRTLSLLKQFTSSLLQQDISEVVSNQPLSILDCLYEFMKQRYIESDVSFLATHDLLNGLSRHSAASKLLMLTTHVTANTLDACMLRYTLLVLDLIRPINWMRVEDFTQFCIIIYPFLNDDDLEAFHLDFVSFGENRISQQLIIDFIITSILKHREPRLLEMETVLQCHYGKETEAMTESEFMLAADDAVSMSCDRLQRHLFHQTAASLGSVESVPVGHLAQITSYLNLLNSAIQVKRDMKHKFSVVST